MLTHPGYYDSLKNAALKYPHPGPSEIEKDLHRSGAGVSDSDIDLMRNILQAFVLRNPSVGYCQGMNFIAGFLYLLLRDEALSFHVMKQIIKLNDMHLLFNTETAKLKMSFYTLDRLISILLPDLHTHSKVI